MSLRRVAMGVGANTFDKLIIATVQLLMVPIFAIHWGLSVYGAWVLLSTIPSFLAVSDLGFATAAGTRMTMLAARGDRDGTVRVFQSAWAVILASSVLLASLAVLAAALVPAHFLPGAPDFPPGEVRTTLLLLLLYGLVSLQGSIFTAAFTCAGHYSLSVFVIALTILFENICAITMILVGGRPAAVAATLLLCRAIGLVVQNVMLRRRVRWLRPGLSHASKAEARSLVAPAMAMLAIPFGQAFFLQGTAIALGAAASEAAVPAFTATRTLARIGLQLTQLVTHALRPEFSAAVARDDRHGQALMLVSVLICASLVLVPFAAALALFGPRIVALWTHGVIHPRESLMLAMALTVVLGGFWNPLSVLFLAMNRHGSFSYPFVVLAFLTMPLTYMLSQRIGATGAAISIVVMDAGMCGVILYQARKLFVSPREMLAAFRIIIGPGRQAVWRRLRSR